MKAIPKNLFPALITAEAGDSEIDLNKIAGEKKATWQQVKKNATEISGLGQRCRVYRPARKLKDDENSYNWILANG
jgi:hypothetical protein